MFIRTILPSVDGVTTGGDVTPDTACRSRQASSPNCILGYGRRVEYALSDTSPQCRRHHRRRSREGRTNGSTHDHEFRGDLLRIAELGREQGKVGQITDWRRRPRLRARRV